MEFRLLGPLEVVAEDRVIDLGGRRQRAVLAALVLRANEVVSVDLLVEDVWGASPPPTAVKAVQGHVSALRKQLGAERIRTTAGGYILALEDGELDSDRFATLVDEARSRNAAGEAGSALQALEEALALWRGPPLADLAYDDFAQAEIARLEELRLAALEERVDVELSRGRHRQLVGDLERLISRHPLRERLRGQLMLALYRSGRQAEALEAYAAARRTLVDELGIEPGRSLQQLEQAILQQSPELDPAPTAAEPDAATLDDTEPVGARRRRLVLRDLVLLAGGGTLVAAAAAAALALTGGGSDEPDDLGNSIAEITPGDTLQVQYTSVGNTPGTIRVGEGAVWVLNSDDQTVSKLDLESGQVVKTFGTGGTPTDLAVGEGAVWVGIGEASPGALSEINTARILQVDPTTATIRRTISLPGRASALGGGSGVYRQLGSSQIAVGARAVWAVTPDSAVARIDPSSGAVLKLPVSRAQSVAGGREGVWLLSADRPELVQIDPRSNTERRRIPVAADSLDGLAVGGGSIWATDPGEGLLWRIVPRESPIARTIETGFGSYAVAFAGGSAWVTNFITDEIVRVDAETNRIQRVRLVGTPPSVTATRDGAWVSVAAAPRRELPPPSACSPVVSGGEEPDVVVASSLALQGPLASTGRLMAEVVRFVVQEHGFRAGPHRVGYQSCDDSTAQTGGFDMLKCASNAKAYAAASRLVGVVGPFSSPCAWAQLPITNRADEPLAMITPSSTHPGLTHRPPDPEPGSDEPGVYYPSGVRHYFRTVSPNDYEGAAGAVLARDLGLRRIYVLRFDDFSNEFALPFEHTARRLGLTIAGRGTWEARAASYRTVADHVAAVRADGVFYAGAASEEAIAGIRALRARIGRQVPLIATEAFLPVPDVLEEGGAAVVGMYLTSTASVPSGLSPVGRRLLKRFAATQPGGVVPSGFYVAEAAQAAEALLAALARSDGTRTSVLRELRGLTITDGVLGSIRFDRNGDITPARFTAYRITGERSPGVNPFFAGARVVKTVEVPRSLIGPAGDGE